jgi:LPXTG-motif cell wall-anchored protein
VKGVASGIYDITETDAPDGYNALTAPVSVEATKLTDTTTSVTKYLDADGNVTNTETTTAVTYTNNNLAADVLVVVNHTGAQLPSTGGMGTTLFYAVGGILVVAAVVFLVSKKRAGGID